MKNIKLTKKYTSNNKKTFKNIKHLNNKSRSNLLDKKNNLKKYKYSNKILVGGSDTSNRGVKFLQNIPPLVNGKGSNGKKKQGKGSAGFQNNDRRNSGVATLTDSRNQSNTTVNEEKINSIVSLTLTSMMNPENLNIIKSQLMQSLLNKNDNKHHSNSKDAVIASESDVKAAASDSDVKTAASESDVKTAVAANPTLLGRRGNNFEPSNSAKLNATKLRLSNNPLLFSNEDNSLKASPGAAVASNPDVTVVPLGQSTASLPPATAPNLTSSPVAPSSQSRKARRRLSTVFAPPSTSPVGVVPVGQSDASIPSTTGPAVAPLPPSPVAVVPAVASIPSTTGPAVAPLPPVPVGQSDASLPSDDSGVPRRRRSSGGPDLSI